MKRLPSVSTLAGPDGIPVWIGLTDATSNAGLVACGKTEPVQSAIAITVARMSKRFKSVSVKFKGSVVLGNYRSHKSMSCTLASQPLQVAEASFGVCLAAYGHRDGNFVLVSRGHKRQF